MQRNTIKRFVTGTKEETIKNLQGKLGGAIAFGVWGFIALVVGIIITSIANTRDFYPTLMAHDAQLELYRIRFDESDQDIEQLKLSDLEQSVQLSMLILYNIPSTERDKLRQEAEAQIAVQKQLEEPAQ